MNDKDKRGEDKKMSEPTQQLVIACVTVVLCTLLMSSCAIQVWH